MYGYELYGLKVNSELELRLYLQKEVHTNPDVIIDINKVNKPQSGLANTIYKPFTIYNQDVYYQEIPTIAKYYLNGKRNLTIEILSTKETYTPQLFFIDSILPILLIKHGMYPIRSSAVHTPQGTYLITGDRGNGKSTLAAFSCLKGHQYVCDNLCVLQWDNGKKIFETRCHHPYISIWKDTFAMFHNKNRKYILIPIRKNLFKYDVDFKFHATTSASKVKGIVFLSTANKDVNFSLNKVIGRHKMNYIRSILHSSQIVKSIAKDEEIFKFNTNIMSAIDIYTFERSILHYPKDFYPTLNEKLFTKAT